MEPKCLGPNEDTELGGPPRPGWRIFQTEMERSPAGKQKTKKKALKSPLIPEEKLKRALHEIRWK